MIELYIKLLRPHQWLKNLMLFFPPFLGGILFDPGVLQKGLLPFVVFCMASSVTYIVNDIRDQEQDRFHPKKQHRPIASGAVPVSHAMIFGSLLFVVSITLAFQLPVKFWVWLMAYFTLSFAYSTVLKDQPIFDIFCIASGFVFRLFAGGTAFGVIISDWLFLTVFLLALFLSLGKRFGEQVLLGSEAGNHRQSLQRYPEGFLESSMYLTGGAVIVTYAIYAIGRPFLVYTVPLCMFGLMRYLLRVKVGQGGDPTEALLKDFPLLVTGILWALLVGWSVYQ